MLLVKHLWFQGVRVRAVKPLSSGARDDACALMAAQQDELALEQINPWHFRARLAPALAARRQGCSVRCSQVLGFLRQAQRDCDVLLIEGAGGLLSPLGEGFDSRDVIRALGAIPIVVCPNRLGAINQALLVFTAMPAAAARAGHLVLSSLREPDPSAKLNAAVLAERLGRERVHVLPWVPNWRRVPGNATSLGLRRVLSRLTAQLLQ